MLWLSLELDGWSSMNIWSLMVCFSPSIQVSFLTTLHHRISYRKKKERVGQISILYSGIPDESTKRVPNYVIVEQSLVHV